MKKRKKKIQRSIKNKKKKGIDREDIYMEGGGGKSIVTCEALF